jgi:predicted alpha/beta superfamily hydrolase
MPGPLRSLALGALASLCLAASPALAAKVTFLVTRVPGETPAGDTLTLGSNVNGWDPAEPGYAFTRSTKGQYTLTLKLRPGTHVEYKLTRGGWPTVEKSADGTEKQNRVHEVKGDATVKLEVARWADSPGPVAETKSTATGTLETLHNVKSPELGNARDVIVYLPPDYKTGDKRYPVLYMHDAQNLFDAATAFVKQEWRADEAAEALARKGQGLIIVGIENNSERGAEYTPFPAPMNGYAPRGDAYDAFVVKTLKPMIDARFRTLPDREHTGVAGSSLGGLISLYMGLSHPDVFGFVGAFSPSFFVADFSLFRWVKARPAGAPLRVYLDTGDREHDSPAFNAVAVEGVEDLGEQLERQGHAVKVVIAKGARHNEDAWAPRLPAVLEWFVTGRGAAKPSPAPGAR